MMFDIKRTRTPEIIFSLILLFNFGKAYLILGY